MKAGTNEVGRRGKEPNRGVGQDLDVSRIYANLLPRWPRVSLATIAGGALGLLFSWARPALYQASATLHIGIDYSRTAQMYDPTVEQAYDRVRGLLLADETLQATLARVAAEGSSSEGESVEEFRGQIRLARREIGWDLLVVDPEPRRAAALANAWAETGLEGIEESTVHALRASAWQYALYEASCQLQPSGTDSSAVWRCSSASPTGESTIPESLLREVKLSHGILPIFSYSWPGRAAIPDQPIVWERATLALAGGLLGWMAGLAWAAFPSALPLPGVEQARTRRRRKQRT